ncbi:MAG: UDP-2,4-diacetamido-2,4,6-trideoxy-beta-L-altropyranose hydrolase [Parvibaculum sp.]|nr:UDP-2,4-diacetamido-2,4,6-trideoxy-beta-L-altropyranose hydrolase [Parvibaculum sp.]
MMHVAFRADAALTIGTGHVMRCLTLARALALQGHNCRFVCRDLPGNLNRQIAAEFSLSSLPPPHGPVPASPPAHAAWAGVGWAQDAAETRTALQAAPIDWLVLDHYAFDARWQKTALPDGTKLMVIDDLADRPHACDLLLDQNLGHEPEDYEALVPAGTPCLTGPRYALLRPEFAAQRAQALAGRAGRGLRHLLISMGGVDTVDATLTILRALPGAPLPENLEIAVIMGAQAPALEQVRALAGEMPWRTKVVVDVRDMAARMGQADLAIGAGGGTTWERCCLGLPSIIVQIAENQAGIAQALAKAGAALDPGPLHTPDFAHRLRAALADARDPGRMAALSENAAALCDGEGVGRVLSIFGQGASA